MLAWPRPPEARKLEPTLAEVAMLHKTGIHPSSS